MNSWTSFFSTTHTWCDKLWIMKLSMNRRSDSQYLACTLGNGSQFNTMYEVEVVFLLLFG